MLRILVVEDDDDIRAGLTRALTQQGVTVAAVARGGDALGRLGDFAPDAVILDLGLPDLDGADVLAMIRSLGDVPVLVATARDDEREIVRLLDAGADDYLIKPYSAAQVLARVRAVLRRGRTDAHEHVGTVDVAELSIDPQGREAHLAGTPLVLTRKEFDLLLYLVQRPGQVVSKRDLLADVWNLPWGGGDRTVDVHVSWLRRKLGESAAEPRFLHSVRGVGVKLVDPS
ncbi:response regulator transcription factor [Aeromicrobium fastidiosum]|uniref:response regulator transcription factor n=1 Tax=Aeromicrobium fastidiosum TaxID=52699 RepID=UPI0020232D4C|nr:response regulator transcription factor [Aeromicrobium fastidiosum]MCL8252449.1 response regulator transcription factor [Aeromicrobium fastidiosum]